MSFELTHVRHLVMLAEHGSFMRAAAALGITQSALSRSIKSLEQRLGMVLFVRNSNGATMTDVGRVYLDRARDLLRLADDFGSNTEGWHATPAGQVTVGAGPYPAEAIMSKATARFIEQSPLLGVKLRVNVYDVLLQQLRSRELDFLVAETSVLQTETDLELPLPPSVQTLYWVARREHPLAQRRDVTTAEVFGWPIVTPNQIPPRVLGPLLTLEQQSSALREPRVFPAVECNDITTVKRIVAHSNAITGMPLTCIQDELESGQFVLLCSAPWLHTSFGVVSLKGRPLTLAAERYRNIVLDVMRESSSEETRLMARWALPDPRPDGDD